MNEEAGVGALFFNFCFLARLKSRLDSLGDGKPGRVASKGVDSPPSTPSLAQPVIKMMSHKEVLTCL